MLAVEGPCDRLAYRPPAGAVTVEAQLGGEPVETAEHVGPRVAELARADDRRDPELALPRQRFRIDCQPGLALRPQDVVAVQILVEEHLLALRGRQLLQRLQRCVEQLPLERTPEPLPGLLDRIGPPGGLGR